MTGHPSHDVPPALRLDGVAKSYATGATVRQIVADVTLAAHASSVLWLNGPSGSGKSTVLRIAGLLTTADRGTVTVAGNEAASTRQRDALRARHIGILFQDANLLPSLTLAQNLQIASLRSDDAVTRGLAATFGLSGQLDQPARLLSGGEAQRAAICRALVNEPAVLLADEPTSALDDANARAVLHALRQAADRGAAVIVASHDPRVGTIADATYTIGADA